MAWNNVKSINKNAFVGLSNLEYLDLNGNEIISVQKNAFIEMPQLKVITTFIAQNLNNKKFILEHPIEYNIPIVRL